jgi:predicted nuclease of predicted toxin-antitoxin system
MLRFLADENFDNKILHALLDEKIDVVRVQDLEIYQADDPTVLKWAAEHERVLLTRDARTMTAYAQERVEQGKPMPGVIEIRRGQSIGVIVDDLLLLHGASQPGELEGQVIFVPL